MLDERNGAGRNWCFCMLVWRAVCVPLQVGMFVVTWFLLFAFA